MLYEYYYGQWHRLLYLISMCELLGLCKHPWPTDSRVCRPRQGYGTHQRSGQATSHQCKCSVKTSVNNSVSVQLVYILNRASQVCKN